MRPEDVSVIRKLALFSDLDEDRFSTLMRASFLQRFPPHVQLISAGDPPDFLYIVTQGCVELFAGANGRETTMALVRPVASFILAAVLNDAPFLMSGRTTEKSQVLMIPSENLRQVMAEDAGFARAIAQELAWAYRSTVKSLKDHKLRTGSERLANHLLKESRSAGDANRFDLSLDKRTLAALLGMTPENLSRAFAKLADHGVKVSGRTIHLSSRSRLESFARPTPLIDDPHS